MNRRFASRLLITSLLLAAPLAATAQEPPPAPPEHRGPGMFHAADPKSFAEHQLKFMTDQLSLTDDQQKQAAAIFTDAATSSSKLQDQLKAAHENMRTAVKNKNAAGVDQGAAVIGNLTAQLIATREKSKIAFAKILTPEQESKLDKLETERVDHMRMPPHHSGMKHGPGMTPPPHRPDAPDGPDGAGGGAPEPPPSGDFMY